jgi:hypothetical protein
MRIRMESQPQNSGLVPVGALQNSTPSHTDRSTMPKHPLAFHTGFEWIAIIKGLRHLKSVENANEAFTDLVHGACPNREIADLFLGACRRYPSNKYVYAANVRLDIAGMLLRRRQVQQFIDREASDSEPACLICIRGFPRRARAAGAALFPHSLPELA